MAFCVVTEALAVLADHAATSFLPPQTSHRAIRQHRSATTSLFARQEDQQDATSTPSPSDPDIRGGAFPILSSPPKLPPLPTLRDYRKFALPCLGLWVSGPLLSLVDTIFIGLSGTSSQSARQLAALGPATTFFDGATYLFAFLNVATTNLYSSARASADHSEAAESVVRTAARTSLQCGIGIMLFLMLTCRPLMKLYIGDKASMTPGLLDSAVEYVTIRALSMPTSLLLGVLQAALLGAKDSVTPLIAILYSTIVNLCGDFVLVNRLGMGLAGAAIATTAAQWAATAALLGPARRKLLHNGQLFQPSSSKTTRTTATTNHKKNGNKQLVDSRAFLAFAAPVLTLILGKLAAFGFMTNAAAGLPNQPTPLASHQIILSLLFFCSPFLEVISQTAQTFLPPFVAPMEEYIDRQSKRKKDFDPSNDKTVSSFRQASNKVGTTLLGLGIASAAVVASAASLVPALGANVITSDGVVQTAVKPLAKYLWWSAFLWAPVAVSEGILLARRELKFLAGVYLMTTALLPPALLRVKGSSGGRVEQVWACFAAFQLFRSLLFTGKIWGAAAGSQRGKKKSSS